MDILTIVIALFSFFFFKWAFRVVVMMILLKLVGHTVQGFKEKGEELKKQFEKGD